MEKNSAVCRRAFTCRRDYIFRFLNRKTETNPSDAAKNFKFSQLTSDDEIMLPSLSPDGKKVAQLRQAKDSELTGIVFYNLTTGKHEVVSDFGDVPVWLNDSRRLIFSEKNKLFLLDTLTKKTKGIITLAPTDLVPGITISPDNRFVYFSLQKKESNLWLGTVE